MNSIIKDIKIRKIKNSKREETIEVTVVTNKGEGISSAPSGTSTGKYEAIAFPKPIDELISEAKKNVIPKIVGMDARNQENIDKTLREIDKTENFSKIGGSVAIAISMAVAKSAADSDGLPLYKYLNKSGVYRLPIPLGKCIGGGAHAKKSTDIQEFLSIPVGAKSFAQAVETNKRMHEEVGKLLQEKVTGFKRNLDYEGGWIANISDEMAVQIISSAALEIMDNTGVEVGTGVDVAASRFWDGKDYVYKGMKGKKFSNKGQLEYISNLIENHGIYYVEDPFHEDDFESHAELTKKTHDVLISGDDLFATNKKRLQRGIGLKACNSIIIKPNQAGTLTDCHETVKFAKKSGYVPVISHRSGETMDVSIAHLAVALEIPFIKIGIVGPEREIKTSELVMIEWKEKGELCKPK